MKYEIVFETNPDEPYPGEIKVRTADYLAWERYHHQPDQLPTDVNKLRDQNAALKARVEELEKEHDHET
jgi:hypothetical protein